MSLKHIAIAVALAAGATVASAADLEVNGAWVRGTVPAQHASGAFMTLSSHDGAKVVGASSPVAAKVEVHEMSMQNGIMVMRPMPDLEVPAGKEVVLAPGSYHIMLMGLKQQLKPGETVPITLQIEGADNSTSSVTVSAEVRPLTAGMPMQQGGMKMQ